MLWESYYCNIHFNHIMLNFYLTWDSNHLTRGCEVELVIKSSIIGLVLLTEKIKCRNLITWIWINSSINLTLSISIDWEKWHGSDFINFDFQKTRVALLLLASVLCMISFKCHFYYFKLILFLMSSTNIYFFFSIERSSEVTEEYYSVQVNCNVVVDG